MVALKRLAGVTLVALALGACASGEPRPNLGLYRQELIHWHESGRYAACFQRAAAPAEAWLDHVIAIRRPGEKVAVVFDIDETLLSNWSYLQKDGFSIDYDTFLRWTRKYNVPPLAPTCRIFNRARKAGIPIFLISGRHEAQRADTARQLHAAGLSGWTGLHLRPDSYADKSIIPFKSGIRRQIATEGYRVILNMGDQKSDLAGGFAERAVKLPNPYYFIP